MFTEKVEVSVGATARAAALQDGFSDWYRVLRRLEHRDFICYYVSPGIAYKGEWVLVEKED